MAVTELEKIAQAIVQKGKGILAADESAPTIAKRFKSIDVESSEENRRAYRELLFTTPGMEEYISGVILFDETIRQKAADGAAFVDVLKNRNVIPGIKVDCGAKPLAGSPDEKVTEGLDGLRDRLAVYYGLGARFTKWRAVITIGDGIPTPYCIRANAQTSPTARAGAFPMRRGSCLRSPIASRTRGACLTAWSPRSWRTRPGPGCFVSPSVPLRDVAGGNPYPCRCAHSGTR